MNIIVMCPMKNYYKRYKEFGFYSEGNQLQR